VLDLTAKPRRSTTTGVADGGHLTASSLTASATGNATSTAETEFTGFALAGGSGSETTATLTQTVNAHIGNNAVVNLAGGASLTATGNATSTATGSALNVSGFDISSMDLSASTGGSVNAFVGDRTTVNAGSLGLSATGTQTPTVSNSFLGISGLNIGLTELSASDTTAVRANVGSLGGGFTPTTVTTTAPAA
jgi:hypothetical protein